MQTVLTFLTGVLLGVLVTWWVLSTAQRRVMRPYLLDGQYQPSRRAVLRHLRSHGTINLSQLERLMDIRGTTALRYLDQMVRDGILKQQGHRGGDAFYTLT
jgi:DNA-binding MarR family transcriptional regulator